VIQTITPALLEQLTERAKAAKRGRTNHNFHQSYDENPNRFLNVMVKGTYITPHRHTTPPKSESFVMLRGRLLFITFHDDGALHTVTRLSAQDNYGIDIGPGIWHSIIVESETAICFEVKPGPYAPASDKDFAPWAPREGEAGCGEYAAQLYAQAVKMVGLSKDTA
jgi:cupin fold WbuC family metalloprotein